ncbi:hypothetical protein CKO09_11695 [Chromatium weissei]|nr:hypothetical protein [Chromatium weissei]
MGICARAHAPTISVIFQLVVDFGLSGVGLSLMFFLDLKSEKKVFVFSWLWVVDWRSSRARG